MAARRTRRLLALRAGFRRWQTDGTAAGTFEIMERHSGFNELVTAGPRLFFGGYDREHGSELWALEP
jgi:hypothetical protein